MFYTVKEVAEISGVTVKTLHHYHKIGLLYPSKITEAGYRLYGERELERLQQIMFYRELDFSLDDIKKALENDNDRLECLVNQEQLLCARRQRLDCILQTISRSIALTKKGEVMDKSVMFQGLNKEEWDEALKEQSMYVKDKYGYELPEVEQAHVEDMNEQAAEAQKFMNSVSNALRSGWKPDDERLQKVLVEHIAFLNSHGHATDAKSFAATSRFFLKDDFHRSMLENHQTGLSYFLCIAAEMYAAV